MKTRIQQLLTAVQSALSDANEIYNDLDEHHALCASENLFQTLEQAELHAKALLGSLG